MTVHTGTREKLVEYIKAGEKKADSPFLLGIELEHIIIDKKTGKAVSYYGEQGVGQILKELSVDYPDVIMEKSAIVGLKGEDFLITLEPAGQLEISIDPMSSLKETQKIYLSFLEKLQSVLEKYKYTVVQFGYQPKDCVENLDLIPKERYRFMDTYFQTIGPFGRQMMRGTASTQITIDYTSEQDFKRKYQLAYQLSPILMFLFDHTPFYEGKENKYPMLRHKIWQGVDEKRVNIFGNIDFSDISYEAYARFVGKAPIIVKQTNEEITYSTQMAKDVYENPTWEEVIHMLSMVFPVVRVKQFLEIRYGDSMNWKQAMCYAAWIKGLFLEIDRTEQYFQALQSGSVKNMDCAFQALIAEGVQAKVYGKPFLDIVQDLAAIVKEMLPEEEQVYLAKEYCTECLWNILEK